MTQCNQDCEICVRIKADILWREAPKNEQERILRSQANIRLQAMASRLEAGVEQMLEELANDRA